MGEKNKLHSFGTPLPELKNDNLLMKRRFVDEQVVRDENGLRRFHGAFTGGCSAGFWNTVGSLNGWQPQEFKSSRKEKALQRQTQRPEDFMDDEDLGEFGIAPQRLQIQNEFAPNDFEEKRPLRKLQNISGPIPGTPVLEQLSSPIHDKVAIRILKSMGWKPGQGVGPRKLRRQKQQNYNQNHRENYLIEKYGFQGNQKNEVFQHEKDTSDSDNEITFAPDDYNSYVVAGKGNRFGLGYTSLRHDSSFGKSGNFNLFETMNILDKKKEKKFTIIGQAFGVGALEEEDEDIYACEDMTNYDFSLDDSCNKLQKVKKMFALQDPHVLDGFIAAKEIIQCISFVYEINLPVGWKARNWSERKSRFSPLSDKVYELLADTNLLLHNNNCLGRHDIKPQKRGEILGVSKAVETKNSTNTTKHDLKSKDWKELKEITLKMDKKSKFIQNIPSKTNGFKPFLNNEAKQQRYEKFLASEMRNETLTELQPIQWDCEMEKQEFILARNLYKPLVGVMSQRFVSETIIDNHFEESSKAKNDCKVVDVIRTKSLWKPVSLLCNIYNVVEPLRGSSQNKEDEKKLVNFSKISIFDYVEKSFINKDKFQNPVITPKHNLSSTPSSPKNFVKSPCSGREKELLISIKKIDNYETNFEKVKQPEMVMTQKEPFVVITELENLSKKIHNQQPAKMLDLFKAIFESNEDKIIKDDDSNVQFSDMSKNANEKTCKLLSNHSSPRSLFSLLFKKPLEKTSKHSECIKKKDMSIPNVPILLKNRHPISDNEVKSLEEIKPYGPKLPGQVSNRLCDQYKTELVSCQTNKTYPDDDWVEKDIYLTNNSQDNCTSSNKHKKKKDSKKSKKKHKQTKKHKTNKNHNHAG